MAGLEDIEQELYRKEFKEPPSVPREPLPIREEPVGQRWSGAVAPPRREKSKPSFRDRWRSGGQRPSRRRLTVVLVTIAVAVLLAAVGVAVYFLYVPKGEVTFAISGPEQLTVGEPTAITIRVINSTAVPLEVGTVVLTFPEGTLLPDRIGGPGGPVRQRLDVPVLASGGTFDAEVRAVFLGELGRREMVSGVYRYRPQGIEGEFIREADFSIIVGRVPLGVSLSVPAEVQSGQEVTLKVSVDSQAAVTLPEMTLGIEFPERFELLASDPPPVSEAEYRWPLGAIEAGASREVTIRGIVHGDPQETKPFHVRVGQYHADTGLWLVVTERSSGPTIASPFLFVQTSLNGNRHGTIEPGVRVWGHVTFRNNLPENVGNIAILAMLPEKLINLESMEVEKGFYDVTRRAITWNPASDPRLRELGPGEEGSFAFSFRLKSALPVRGFGDKNFVLSVQTIVDSLTPPPAYQDVSLKYRDLMELKVESLLKLAGRVAYYDSPVANTGPLPPKVRQTTTYTLYLQLSSGANDHRDVEVRGQLAGGVEWREVVRTDGGAASFNPATQEFVWRLPQLAAATGIVRSPATAIVRVALTPAENQINGAPVLLRGISVSGRDAFTGTDHKATIRDLNTELRGDPNANSLEWRVVP